MGRRSINIPDVIADYAERQVHQGRFDTVDAFFERLVHFDEEERVLSLTELHERLDAAKASGISELDLTDIVRESKAELKARGAL